ncbi:MAG: hypothetical protein HY973_03850 [Candidatus Kerfeldbacteria bacterium]|nr:hypothetical protein [Candidatus Kerfeldbacteria bacterium]
MLWKLPPRIKVYEALGAIADGRVELVDEHNAHVHSSARQKTYDVSWNLETNEITSNDNGSYWQKYLSYPGLAVLMLLGKLPYEEKYAQAFKGISWGNLNEEMRRDYVKVEEYVLSLATKQGVNRDELYNLVTGVLEALAKLQLSRPAVLKLPPKNNY